MRYAFLLDGLRWRKARWVRAQAKRCPRRKTWRPTLEVLEDRLSPAVVTWDGGGGPADTRWFTPANWDGDVLPTAADDVVIELPGTYTVTMNGNVTVAGLTLGGSDGTQTLDMQGFPLTLNGSGEVNSHGVLLVNHVLGGSGSLLVYGQMNWSSSVVSLSGGVTIAPDGTLLITSQTGKSLGAAMNNEGNTVWMAGNVSGDGVFNNRAGATFHAEGNGLNEFGGSQGVFRNEGDLVKTGNGETRFGSDFHNHGTVSVEAGTFRTTAGGVHTGDFLGAPNSILYFDVIGSSGAEGNTFNAGASVVADEVRATGIIQFNAGSSFSANRTIYAGGVNTNHVWRFDTGGSVTVENFDFAGDLGGGDDMIVNGLFEWRGGIIRGANGSRLDAKGGLLMNGLGWGGMVLDGRTLTNTGTGTWTEHNFSMQNNAVFDNDGVFEARIGNVGFVTGPGVFNNRGVFRKLASTAEIFLWGNFSFQNSGRVEIQTGDLQLGAATDSTGSFVVSAGATLKFGGQFQTNRLRPGSSVTGLGTVVFSYDGTTLVEGAYAVDGLTRFTGGSPVASFANEARMGQLFMDRGILTGAGTVVVSGEATLGGPGVAMTGIGTTILQGASLLGSGFALGVTGRTLLNQGSMIVTGAGLEVRDGAVFDNRGAFEIQNGSISGSNASVINSGTIIKSVGTATSTLTNPITNHGVIEVRTGTLTLQNGLTNVVNETVGHRLNGGSYLVAGTLRVPGLDLRTNAANIVLDGPDARILSDAFLDTNALVNFATNEALSDSSPKGRLTVTGGGSLTTTGDFTNNGELNIDSGSTFTVNGDYRSDVLVDGESLTLGIGDSPSSGKFGKLTVSGEARLSGLLDIDLVNGFAPEPGQSYPVIDFADAPSRFDSTHGMRLGRVEIFDDVYDATNLTLVTTGSGIVDLVTESIDLSAAGSPAAGVAGESATIRYTVRNSSSTVPAVGTWIDSVYLSANGLLDASSRLLGRVAHSGDVEPLATYTETISAPLPASFEGEYRVIVVSDSRGFVPDRDRTNNQLAASETIQVAIPILTLGSPVTGLIADGQDHYFRLESPPGKDVQLAADFPATYEAEFFVRSGKAPTRTTFDQASPNLTQLAPRLLIAASSDPIYVLLHGREGAGLGMEYTLLARTDVFEVSAMNPPRGSNAGIVTATLSGAGFSPQTVVTLVNSNGDTRAARQVIYKGGDQLFAKFDLTGLPVGVYDLRIEDAGRSATRLGAFTVSSGNPGRLRIDVQSPTALRLRPGRLDDPPPKGTVTVYFSNEGETDIPNSSLALNFEDAVLGSLSSEFGTSCDIQLTQVFYGSGGGGLSPGGGGSATYSFQAMNASPAPPGPELEFNLNLPVADDSPIEWEAKKQAARPVFISEEAWDVLFPLVTERLGATNASAVAAISDAATYLAQLGEPITDPNVALGIIISEANNSTFGLALDARVDAAAPAPGLPLTMARIYTQPISQRYYEGAFGRGWRHLYDTRLLVEDCHNFVVDGVFGTRNFRRATDRQTTCGGLFGDQGLLLDVQWDDATGLTGTARLIEPGGVQYLFAPDGNLLQIQDANFNTINLFYDDEDHLTDLVHSNGDRFALEYNSAGRVRQLTDHAGQVTTYVYDGEHLVDVANAAGTTHYEYDAGHVAPPRRHALTVVANTNGTHRFFTYDDRGRLIAMEGDQSANAVEFQYGSHGTVTTVSAAGASTVLFNQYGQPAQTFDASRGIYRDFDKNGNLVRLRLPDSATFHFAYDAHGFPTSITDAAGNVLEQKFERTGFMVTGADNIGMGTNFRLAELTDQRGAVTDFNYDAFGNLVAIKHGDEPAQQFGYDLRGNLTQSRNRRNQSFAYAYNDQGQITFKKHFDGTQEQFTYDDLGNLRSASNERGATTFDYDDADRLTRVAYPNGRTIEYAYGPDGRPSRLTADGFVVQYVYDYAGRLSQLRDGNGATIVAYEYDSISRLIREEHANATFTTYEYDAIGQLEHLVNHAPGGSLNSRFDYTYNSLGLRSSMTTLDGSWSYEYDPIGQLAHAVFISTNGALPNQDLSYDYDAAGNRVRTIENGETTVYDADGMNRYQNVGRDIYAYDADGNLTEKRCVAPLCGGEDVTTHYAYDDESRLIRVDGPDGSWTYEYDVLGNRMATVYNGQRTEYLIDPTGLVDVLAEYGPGGATVRFIHGLGLESRVAADGKLAFYDFDAVGSTAGLSVADGAYANKYAYSPFGEALAATPEMLSNPFEFVGQFGVMREGNGLDYQRARFYQPENGRFISEDPSGIGGGTNLYGYAANNPATLVDPLGNAPQLITPADFEAALAEIQATLKAQQQKQLAEYLRLAQEEIYQAQRARVVASARASEVTQIVRSPLAQAIETGVRPALVPFEPILGTVRRGAVAVGAGVAIAAAVAGYLYIYAPGIFSYPGGLVCRFTNCDGDGDVSFTQLVASSDPNDIVGPAGYGPEGFLTPDIPLNYTIHFENMAEATAPAQTVTITEQLDADLDFATFQIGGMGFGDNVIAVPPGRTFFSTRLALDDAGRTIDPDGFATPAMFLDVTAAIDVVTGVATWSFTSLDPATFDLPFDVFAGFLPPNVARPEGEGYVSYSIRPKSHLPTGARLDAGNRSAGAPVSIIFDENAPIDTLPIRHTLDVGPPTSGVDPLSDVTRTRTFTVTWSGSDDVNGSGIAYFNIFVSDNGGSFAPFLRRTQQHTAEFTGEFGHEYAFYSVATDNVGLVQATPAEGQAATLILGASWQNPNLRWDVDDDAAVTLADLLEIVLAVREHGGAFMLPEPGEAENSPPPYLDVNGDEFASLADLMETVQKLRDDLAAPFAGEGEQEAPSDRADVISTWAPEPMHALRWRKDDNHQTGDSRFKKFFWLSSRGLPLVIDPHLRRRYRSEQTRPSVKVATSTPTFEDIIEIFASDLARTTR